MFARRKDVVRVHAKVWRVEKHLFEKLPLLRTELRDGPWRVIRILLPLIRRDFNQVSQSGDALANRFRCVRRVHTGSRRVSCLCTDCAKRSSLRRTVSLPKRSRARRRSQRCLHGKHGSLIAYFDAISLQRLELVFLPRTPTVVTRTTPLKRDRRPPLSRSSKQEVAQRLRRERTRSRASERRPLKTNGSGRETRKRPRPTKPTYHTTASRHQSVFTSSACSRSDSPSARVHSASSASRV